MRGLFCSLLFLCLSCGRGEPYVIGVVLGADGERGAQLAVDDINAQGGVNGRALRLKLIAGAGGSSARVALEAAERFARDPSILAVIGHSNSGASLAASQVYNAHRLVQIAPTTTSPIYSHAGAYSFRMVPSDVHQAQYLADMIARDFAGRRVAMVYVNDDYGRALHTLTSARFRALGIVLVYDAGFAEDERFAEDAEIGGAIVSSRPDVLLWLGRAYQYVGIAPRLRRDLPGLQIIASDGFGGPYVDQNDRGQYTGVRYVRITNLDRPDSALRAFRTRYEAQNFGRASDQAILSYDAVQIIARAIGAVGSDRTAIRDWIASVGTSRPVMKGLSGTISFDGADRRPDYLLDTVGHRRAPAPR